MLSVAYILYSMEISIKFVLQRDSSIIVLYCIIFGRISSCLNIYVSNTLVTKTLKNRVKSLYNVKKDLKLSGFSETL